MTSDDENDVVVTLGEIMLRLKAPGVERLFQGPVLEASFGGSEANVAATAATLGRRARFVSAVPANAAGDAAIRFLRSLDVDTSCIARKGERLGIYFLETGSGPRPSAVIYDRAGSSINDLAPGDVDWDRAFSGAAWFHVSGITPALSEPAARLTIEAIGQARNRGVPVSCDLNHRKNLWRWGKPATEVMNDIARHVDVLVANEEDIQASLGIDAGVDVHGGTLDEDKYRDLCERVAARHPGLQAITVSLRKSHSADHNDWSAMCHVPGEGATFTSRVHELRDIVDRVGAGDAFAGAFIVARLDGKGYRDALEFAVAASALKHTIPGDVNRATRAEIDRLVQGDTAGRVRR